MPGSGRTVALVTAGSVEYGRNDGVRKNVMQAGGVMLHTECFSAQEPPVGKALKCFNHAP